MDTDIGTLFGAIILALFVVGVIINRAIEEASRPIEKTKCDLQP